MNVRLLLLFLLVSTGALAQGPGSPDGLDSFTIFDPKPRAAWRPLSADRPDFTESPYTVDPGAFQIELSLLDFAREGSSDALSILPTNFKVGLSENVDLQFVLEPWVRASGGGRTREGFGTFELRTKVNLHGNDGGDSALAVMPFLRFPTAEEGLGPDEIEGGLMVPFATELGEGVGLGLMLEGDLVHDAVEDEHDVELLATAALGVDLGERLGAYGELIGIQNLDGGGFDALFGMGLTWQWNEDLVLDVGAAFGLTDGPDDVNVFTGLTFRF